MPEGIDGWLTKTKDGKYIFSYFRPEIKRIRGTHDHALYPGGGELGDPWWHGLEKPLCPQSIAKHEIDIDPFTSIRVRWTIEILNSKDESDG